MSIAKIIVPLTGGTRDAAVLATAFAAARPFNAHVSTLIVHSDPRLAIPMMGAPLRPEIMQNIINAAEELNRSNVTAAHAMLNKAAAAENVSLLDRPERKETVTYSFEETVGIFAETLVRAARLCDLVVLGPLAAPDGGDVNESFVHVLTRTDRSVLLSATVPAKLTGNLAVAWDGSAAACHAVIGAMPFLRRARSVVVLHMGPNRKENGDEYGLANKAGLQELTDYLALHGVGCGEKTFERGMKNIGEAVLDAAAGCGADLLVMGGYGHGHLRETIFGGVTNHISRHARLPVLMVH